MQIHSVLFAISRQIDKQKVYAKTIKFLCKGNKAFVKYQAQGVLTSPVATGVFGGLIPQTKLQASPN